MSDLTMSLVRDLQKLDSETWNRIDNVLAIKTGTLKSIVEISGLNPSTDFRGINFAGISLAGSDITGFDFSFADLRGCEIRKAVRNDSTILKGAVLDRHDRQAISLTEIERTERKAPPRKENEEAPNVFAESRRKPRASGRRFDDLL